MQTFLYEQGIYFLQLLLAGLCGFVIGGERQSKMKTAGVRTHVMVAIASALMMMISKYGFQDVIQINGMSCDPSRVAAGIITGIGILGGGLIFISKQGRVSGITTATGIWVTVGIGMAMGAGMYVLGFEATALALFAQLLLNGKSVHFKDAWRGQIVMEMENDEQKINEMLDILKKKHIDIAHMKYEYEDKKRCRIRFTVTIGPEYSREEINQMLCNEENIISYEF